MIGEFIWPSPPSTQTLRDEQSFLRGAASLIPLGVNAKRVANALAPRALLLARLLATPYGVPDVVIGADGSLGLLWTDEATFYIDVDFGADTSLHFYVRFGSRIAAEQVLTTNSDFEPLLRVVRPRAAIEFYPNSRSENDVAVSIFSSGGVPTQLHGPHFEMANHSLLVEA